jgi:hypothetical protein
MGNFRKAPKRLSFLTIRGGFPPDGSHLPGVENWKLKRVRRWLLQLRVLGLGLLQDGDVGVGVFPKGEEIVAGGERAFCLPLPGTCWFFTFF